MLFHIFFAFGIGRITFEVVWLVFDTVLSDFFVIVFDAVSVNNRRIAINSSLRVMFFIYNKKCYSNFDIINDTES